MNEDEIIKESILEIKQILGIIKSEVCMIEDKGRSKKEVKKNSIDEDVRANLLVAKKNYLDFFRKIVNFIFDKLNDGSPDKDFFFYIPHLRTLIEIYAYLLYMCFQDDKRQMELVISKTLYTLAKLDSSQKTKEIQEQYRLYYESVKPFMDREGIIFPEDSSEFSNRWLKKSGYDYPPVDQMLKTEWIKESSPQMTFSSKNIESNPYYIYKHFSNYIHGNALSKETYGNEKFWIISETLMLSCRMAELISIKVLDNPKRKEIAEWIKRVSQNNPKFVEVWNLKRVHIEEERNNKQPKTNTE